jgi:hypothetical protein
VGVEPREDNQLAFGTRRNSFEFDIVALAWNGLKHSVSSKGPLGEGEGWKTSQVQRTTLKTLQRWARGMLRNALMVRRDGVQVDEEDG